MDDTNPYADGEPHPHLWSTSRAVYVLAPL